MVTISLKREYVATNALQVLYVLLHTTRDSQERAQYCKYHTGRLSLQLVLTVCPCDVDVVQVLSLWKCVRLRVREVIVCHASLDSTQTR